MSEKQEAPPALFQYCVDTYNLMLASAKLEHLDQGDGTTRDAVIWEGMATALVTQKMMLSVPYFTFIFQALKRMECVVQLRRGGGTAPSRWELKHEPTLDLFTSTKAIELHVTPTKRTSAISAVLEQMAAMNLRLLKCEKALEVIIKENVDV